MSLPNEDGNDIQPKLRCIGKVRFTGEHGRAMVQAWCG